MTHTQEVSCRSLTYLEMHRDTVFTIIVIHPDMHHDSVSLVVSSRFLAFCVSAVARALPCVCLVTRTHVSLPMFYLKFHCRKCPMQKRVNWKQQVNWKVSSAYLNFSRGMKVNEFADLIATEFVSEYTEYTSNIVWNGRKHLGTREDIDEPLDQVKLGNCFQSCDEGPSFFLL